MKLYINKNIDAILLDEAMPLLSPQRREKVSEIRHEGVRRQSIAAYLLLCRALREEYGITSPPTFDYEEGGKPFLTDRPDIHFNFSHCKGAVACAVSDTPVGVDIETIHKYNEALCRKVLSEEEHALVLSSDRPDLEFTKLWTRKEALLKLTGEGIRDDLKDILHHPSPNTQHPTITTTTDGNLVYSVAEFF